MDFAHCRLVMEALGRFHALSFALRDKNPEEFKRIGSILKETYYHEKFYPWYSSFLKTMLRNGCDAVSKEYSGTLVEKKMLDFVGDERKFYDTLVSLCSRQNEYSVFTHGDCWMPNFLFSYTETNSQKIPEDIKIIDYQLARLASPATDISFFIYSCTVQDLREKHYDELIQIYHKNLSDLLRNVGSDPDKLFPFTALQVQLIKFNKNYNNTVFKYTITV